MRLGLAPLKCLLAKAVQEGLIRSNPSVGLRLNLATRKAEEGGEDENVKALTEDELRSRGSIRLVEAAQRLGEMRRSENIRTAVWADSVVSEHILGQPARFVP